MILVFVRLFIPQVVTLPDVWFMYDHKQDRRECIIDLINMIFAKTLFSRPQVCSVSQCLSNMGGGGLHRIKI